MDCGRPGRRGDAAPYGGAPGGPTCSPAMGMRLPGGIPGRWQGKERRGGVKHGPPDQRKDIRRVAFIPGGCRTSALAASFSPPGTYTGHLQPPSGMLNHFCMNPSLGQFSWFLCISCSRAVWPAPAPPADAGSAAHTAPGCSTKAPSTASHPNLLQHALPALSDSLILQLPPAKELVRLGKPPSQQNSISSPPKPP